MSSIVDLSNAWITPGWIRREHIAETNLMGGLWVPSLAGHEVTISWTIKTIIKEKPISSMPVPSFANVIADLFNDVDASNVVFILHNPGRFSQVERYIHAHTKILAMESNYFKTSAHMSFII